MRLSIEVQKMLMRSFGLTVLCASLSFAQAPAGLPKLSTLRPTDGTHVYTMTLRRNKADSVSHAGSVTVQQKTISGASGPVILRVVTFEYGAAGTTIDSTWSVARTLAPIRERTVKPRGLVDFDVNGDSIVGRVVTNGVARAVHESVPGPTFNATDLDLIVRSLPLADGYRVQFPIYDPEGGGYRMASARVDGRTPARDAWLVSVRENDVLLEYTIAVATRDLIASTVVNNRSGFEFSMTLTQRKLTDH
jgi:hypothetical protein